MLLFYALLLFGSPLEKSWSIPVPEPLYRLQYMASDGQELFALDKKSSVIAKMNASGEVLQLTENKGEGPGGLNRPRTIAIDDEHVYVGYLLGLAVFKRSDLSFVRQLDLENNPQSLAIYKDKLFLGITSYPATDYAVSIRNMDGTTVANFYNHNEDKKSLKMPFIAHDQKQLFVFSRGHYQVDTYSFDGKKLQGPEIMPPPQYRPKVPAEKYEKKYGKTKKAYALWRTQWSEPVNVAVLKNRYLLLNFKEKAADLLEDNYFISAYDLRTGKRVIAWEPSGRLLCGGPLAFFFESTEQEDQIVAYDWPRELQN